MILRIVTTKKVTEYDVDWTELNTPAGNMIIGHGHSPLIIELSPNQELIYKTADGVHHKINIIQGIAHINRTIITILLPIDL